MNYLIEYFARQKTLVEIITIFVIAAGAYFASKIQREVFPNISFDVVQVRTTFPGASADAVERLITSPLEQGLVEVDGIKQMTSVSVENQSVISLQLDPDQVSSDEAESDIQDVIDAFSDLPDDALDPVVFVLESKQNPILSIGISTANRSELELREVVKNLEYKIESISDVAKVNLTSYRDQEVIIKADPKKMARYKVSLQELIRAIQANNANIPGGILEASQTRSKEMIVRTIGEYESAEDVKNTVIRANALAVPIRVSDVAEVELGFAKRSRYVGLNGTFGIDMVVLKKERGDAINLANRVKRIVEAEKELLGSDYTVKTYNDSSFLVKRRLSVLLNNLGVGLLLVLIILSIALPIKVALITAIGIPFAFLGAITLFDMQGISLNLLSMMGLIIVVGMLVDDAVVVTENAQRNIDRGMSPVEGAIAGTKEIWAPVTASVFTTIIAFAPMMFMSGIFGKFVKFIPIGVILALLISLFECFFILPNHIAHWVKPARKQKDGTNKVSFFNRIWQGTALPLYEKTLGIILKLRYLAVLILFSFFGFSFWFAANNMDFILFPKGNIDTFFINFETEIGTPLDETMEKSKIVSDKVKTLFPEELQDFSTIIGSSRSNGVRANTGTNIGQVIVYLIPGAERKKTADGIIAELKEAIGEDASQFKKLVFEQQRGGPPVGKPLSIGVRGKDYERINEAVAKVKLLAAEIDGVRDVEDSYVKGKNEIQVRIDPSESNAAQLTLQDIGTTIRAAYEGVVPTSIRKLDEEIEVRVTLPSDNRSEIDTLRKLSILNSRGSLIPLERVASFDEHSGIAIYEHENNRRQVKVEGELDESIVSAKGAQAQLTEKIKPLKEEYPDLTFAFGGEAADTDESVASLKAAFAFAFFGILLLLILLFKNLYQPIVVAMTIPIGVSSVIWAFYFSQQPLSFLGVIGIIALAGVIVNNAIVMVDFVNQHRSDGLGRIESITEAAKVRLRPIALTTLTTTAGIIPTAYGWGGADPFVVPIALALGWGVFLGSIMTTLVFPAVLAVFGDIASLLTELKRTAFAAFTRPER